MKLTNLFLILFLCISCVEDTNQEVDIKSLETFEASFAIGEKKKLWGEKERKSGKTVKLNVYIMDSDAQSQMLVEDIAPEWSKYGNVDFIFSTDPESQEQFDIVLKIHFEANEVGKGGVSHVGIDSKTFSSKTEPSMELWFTPETSLEAKRRYILHEFGHALGLKHEHHHPDRTFEYNEDKVYADCEKDSWSRSDCNMFKIKKIKGKKYLFFDYDIESIMHYGIHKDALKDSEESIIGTTELSEIDKITIATLYPGRMNEADVKALAAEARLNEIQAKQREIQLASDLVALGKVKNCEISHITYNNKPAYSYKRIGVSWAKAGVTSIYTDKFKLVSEMMKDSRCAL